MNIYEELAKIADDLWGEGPEGPYDNGGTRDGWNLACRKIAEEIRCRDKSLGMPDDLMTQEITRLRAAMDRGRELGELALKQVTDMIAAEPQGARK